MNRLRYQLRTLAIAAPLMLVNALATAQTLVDDFDNANNPGNGWVHGFNDAAVGGSNDIANDIAFGLANLGGNPGDRWTGDGTGDGAFPPNDLMLVNVGNGGTAGDHWGGGEMTWDAGVSYHTWGDSAQAGGINGLSGDDTIFSTYTVDVAGNYDITGAWTENGNSGGASVEVLLNGVSLGTGAIDLDVDGSNALIQSLGVDLSIGDTVSFRTTRDTDVQTGGAASLDASIINTVPQTLTLQVDVNTGEMRLTNLSGNPITFDAYQITSEGDPGSLDSTGFNGAGGDLPAFPLGTGNGDGWELSEGNYSRSLTDSYILDGGSTLEDGEVLMLGFAYDDSLNAQDLAITIAQPDGGELIGLIDYDFQGAGVPGDFNSDGVVDSIDYAVFRENLNSLTPLPNDNGLGTPVSSLHFDLWLSQYGASSGAAEPSDVSAAPEPVTLALLIAAACFALLLERRRPVLAPVRVVARNAFACRRGLNTSAAALCVAWVVLGSTTQAAVTLDRQYLFGDDTTLNLEGATNGAVIGSNNTPPLGAGETIDSVGPSGAYIQLAQTGDPLYANVGSTGLNRPGAVPNSLGAAFDGTNDYLLGIPLNRPEDITTALPSFPLNYAGITTRGLQMWVYPEQAGINAGNYQSIVFDTARSGGPAINAAGQWTQSNAVHVDTNPVPVAAEAEVVVGDQWYHVMQHVHAAGGGGVTRIVPGTGATLPFTSIVYVDGVAVSANNDDIGTGGLADYPGGKLVVGAAEVPFDQVNETYGLFFDGVVDDLEMYIYGDNTSQGGQDYGAFDLFSDNEWIANQIANDPILQGALNPGDINRDGQVNGDGTGPVGSDDVSAFIAGWGSQNILQGAHNQITAGDWNTWAQGDLNLDGTVTFADWFILRANHSSAASLDLATLLNGGTGIPEPTTAGLLTLVGLGGLLGRGRNHRSQTV